jgi:hypothetical protein
VPGAVERSAGRDIVLAMSTSAEAPARSQEPMSDIDLWVSDIEKPIPDTDF